MRFGLVPSVPSRRPLLARTQLQPISRKREQNNSYRGANTCTGTRAKETRKHRERSKTRVQEYRRERKSERAESRRDPLSSATPTDVPFPLSPPFVSPVNPILEARWALPRTSQARFLNFVTFKFKHSHLLRSPPPQRLCLLPMPISCLFPLAFFLSPSLIFLSYSITRLLPPFFRFIICMRTSILRRFFSATQWKHERAHVSIKNLQNEQVIWLIHARRISSCFLDMLRISLSDYMINYNFRQQNRHFAYTLDFLYAEWFCWCIKQYEILQKY